VGLLRSGTRPPSLPRGARTAQRAAGTLAGVNATDLRDLVHFSDDGPVHAPVHESERLWSELVCLDRNQGIGPITDPDSDAICLVVTGKIVVQLDRGRKRLSQWETVLVPAGSSLVVTNASPDPAVVLLVAAPPPPARTPSD
jgi:quercetin dioxygenase-like cupin family protein